MSRCSLICGIVSFYGASDVAGGLPRMLSLLSAKNPELQDSDNSDSKSVMEGLIKTVNGVLDVAGACIVSSDGYNHY